MRLFLMFATAAALVAAGCSMPPPPRTAPPDNLAAELDRLKPTLPSPPPEPKFIEVDPRTDRRSVTKGPNEYDFPRAVPKSEKELVERPVEAECDALPDPASGRAYEMRSDQEVVGVVRSEGDAAAGELAADMLNLELAKEHKLRIVDRNRIKDAEREWERVATDVMRQSETEKAKFLGQALRLTHTLYVTVTQYDTERRDVPIEYRIDENDWLAYRQVIEKYRQDYAAFETQYLGPFGTAWAQYREECKRRQEEYEKEYANYLVRYEHYLRDFESAKAFKGAATVVPRVFLAILTFGLAWIPNDELPEPPAPKQTDFIPVWYHPQPIPPDCYLRAQNHVHVAPFPPQPLPRPKEPSSFYETREAALERLKQLGHFKTGDQAEKKLMTVAEVGLTLRLVDSQTTRVVWVGRAAKRHTTLQGGLRELTKVVCRQLVEEDSDTRWNAGTAAPKE